MRIGRRCKNTAWLTLLLSLGLVACEEPPPPEHVLRPVRFQVVSPSSSTRVRTFAGVARAGLESRLSFRVSGTVVEVPVVVGETVHSGQILARIDPTDYELKVQEAVAALAQSEAAARNAEADYERVRGLYENNNASRRELDAARAGSESSQAQVEATKKRLEQARQQLSYCTLRAPSAGTVASAAVEINENINAGHKLFLLIAGADTEVQIPVPEALIVGIHLGQQATVAFNALPGRKFAATVTGVGATSVGTATTFPVTVHLTDTNSDIRSGMAAEVSLGFATNAGADRKIVPAVSVGEDREGRFVFVLEKTDPGQGVVHRKSVSVGELTGEGLEVLSGLTDGELIVTAGVRRLMDGQEVALAEEEP